MARKPGSGKEKSISQKNMRADIVSQWVGASRPLNLERNITEAGAHIEAILESIGVQGGLDEERVKEGLVHAGG